jgi:hypothetical protein
VERKKHIFVFPLLIAWLIIFAHDVIPHNHHTPIQSCHSSQGDVHEHAESERNLTLGEEAPEECCHFSVDILHEFSFDHEIIPPVFSYNLNCDIKVTNHYFKEYHLLIFDAVFLDQRQSRGPPSSTA